MWPKPVMRTDSVVRRLKLFGLLAQSAWLYDWKFVKDPIWGKKGQTPVNSGGSRTEYESQHRAAIAIIDAHKLWGCQRDTPSGSPGSLGHVAGLNSD